MALQALRNALLILGQATLRPDEFFAEHDLAYDPFPAILIGAGFAAFLAGAVVAIGLVMAATIDVTVTIDNPDRPADWVCEQQGTDATSPWYDRCQEPESIERAVGPMLLDIALARVPLLMLVALFFWPILGAMIHVTSWAAGGTGPVSNSLSVAAFGLIPEAVRTILVIVVFYFTFDSATLTGDTPAAVVPQLLTTMTAIGPIILFLSIITSAWQLYILTYGLKHGRNLSIGRAAAAGATVVGLLLVIELL